MTTGATLNRGNSEQAVGTPREFLGAVERRFGLIGVDLAAVSENRVCENYIGPDHENELLRDSLSVDWNEDFAVPVRWLNPPFGRIEPWAKKCAYNRFRPFWTLLLVPYSADANWWRDYVRGKAMVFALQPRLKFVGHAQPYPNGLALCAYGYGVCGEDNWTWKRGKK